jgi:hypothetical protein
MGKEGGVGRWVSTEDGDLVRAPFYGNSVTPHLRWQKKCEETEGDMGIFTSRRKLCYSCLISVLFIPQSYI